MKEYKQDYERVSKGMKKVMPEGIMPMSMLPMFTVSMDSIPEAKKWEVGKKYKLVLEVTQKNVDMHRGVTFQIERIKPV